ncbi:hypothetical protein SETIT_9G038200v2 [Setaria italica]|uniref:F-box associated beta-propeller type 3 domain-containing protein n=1 Tax=Setaria italica TaxID=4555 RepID=A0A368SD25_SETIT|nr:hypothetical protein SETIT_9G038200v2 [Setaria italica]
MAKRKARDDEVAAAPRKSSAAMKRTTTTRATTSSTPGMCDDVLRSIFARVPARTAVASMALSKHHRRLMRCPDFRALHCRLAPPLPRPHVAYVATAKVSAAATPRCNGVVLLAGGKPRPTTCVLWNPAIADEEKEVTIPVSTRDDCAILGLGYSATTKTYKLLLTRRRMRSKILLSSPPIVRYPKELLVYTLSSGGVERKKKPRLRTVLSGEGVVGEITGQSLYMDGTIYLLHVSKSAILAFDVDSETVTNIGLPEPRHAISKLMEVSGRPCLDILHPAGGGCLQPACFLPAGAAARVGRAAGGEEREERSRSAADARGGKLYMYRVATKAMDKAKLLYNLSPEGSDYALCWGYKPTFVSPGSIVGELSQEAVRPTLQDCTAEIMEALKPLSERDKRKGKKATLDIVCFMEFLVRIMQKLPENVHDVLRMPLLNSDAAAYSSSKNELYYSDSDSDF